MYIRNSKYRSLKRPFYFKIAYIFILSFLMVNGSFAQESTSFFTGKWYLIIKGMPQGDAKSILTITEKDGRFSGKITNPIKPSELVDLLELNISETTITAKFRAFETELPLSLEKVNDELRGMLMQRFPTEGSKKALFSLDDSKTKAKPQVATDTLSAKVVVDFNQKAKPFVRTEQYNNIAVEVLTDADINFYNQNGLHEKILRVWSRDEDFYDFEKEEYRLSTLDDYLQQASKLSDYLLLNFGASGVLSHFEKNPEKIQPVYTEIFSYLKQKFPQIKFIEIMNEPDFGAEYMPHVNEKTYYSFYKYAVKSVVTVNQLLHPQIPLEVGGPSVAKFDIQWLSAFLEDYKNDNDANKKLDFISYHAYFQNPKKVYEFLKDDPSLVKSQRKILDSLLISKGLSTEIPAFITETGIYPGPLFDEAGSTRNDHLRQAAGVASIFYWFLESDNIYPFHWVMRHLKEGRKDQLVTRDEFEDPFRQENKFTPYGNSMVMLSKLKSLRLPVQTSVEPVKGLYAMASTDNTGIAVMVWNYQGVKNTGFKTELMLRNLPKDLKNKKLKFSIYKIDSQNSNYHADLENSNLKVFEEKIIIVKDSFKEPLFLDPNALQLVILEKAE